MDYYYSIVTDTLVASELFLQELAELEQQAQQVEPKAITGDPALGLTGDGLYINGTLRTVLQRHAQVQRQHSFRTLFDGAVERLWEKLVSIPARQVTRWDAGTLAVWQRCVERLEELQHLFEACQCAQEELELTMRHFLSPIRHSLPQPAPSRSA